MNYNLSVKGKRNGLESYYALTNCVTLNCFIWLKFFKSQHLIYINKMQ